MTRKMVAGLNQKLWTDLIHFQDFRVLNPVFIHNELSIAPKRFDSRWMRYFGIKPFIFSWLISIDYTVYYWDKPISESSYVGFALFLYLRQFCWNNFLMFVFSWPIFVILERTKIWQNLYLSVICQLCWLLCSQICFTVMLMMLWHLYIQKQIYIYTFHLIHLLKIHLK